MPKLKTEMESEIQKQVEAYCQVKETYEAFADFLGTVLTSSMNKLGISANISTRAKGKPNFVEKMIRKQGKCPDPIHQFTDLCGARIIVDFTNDIEPVCNFIQSYFDIDEANSEDAGRRLGASEFGYRSVHYIVSLNKDKLASLFDDLELNPDPLLNTLPPALYAHSTENACAIVILPTGPMFKAEIQVRTLLQHAWAVFAHDRVYKSDFNVPDKWKRDTNRIAATLENADNEFARTIEGIESYRTYFGAYMTREERKDEVKILDTVFKLDPQNRDLAHQIARLALSLEEWNIADDVLRDFVVNWEASAKGKIFKTALESCRSIKKSDNVELAFERLEAMRDTVISSILLDYGWAKWKQNEKSGIKYIDWACELDHRNADARIALGDIHADDVRQQDKSLACYEEAFRVSPTDPRALSRFILSKIAQERNIDFISLVRPILENGILTCRDRANVGVYLPEAFYDMGMFYLLLGNPYESLNAFACAVQRTDSISKIENALERVEALGSSLRNGIPDKYDIQLEWIIRFLSVAKVGKLLQINKALKEKRKTIQEAITKFADKKTQKETEEYQKQQAMLEKTTQEEKESAAKLELERKEELHPLLSTDFPDDITGKPLLIVAGCCDTRFEPQICCYKPLFETAFKDFFGAIISGGTTAGISGYAGDIPSSPDKPIRKISYLPKYVPSWTSHHKAYQTYLTNSSGFSALEPIQGWIDILSSGVDPVDVKLLGINGGKIAAFEYRMAIMLGAKVGILHDSGRAARDIWVDQDWADAPNLFALPNDAQTIKAFVYPLPPSKMLTQKDREAMAIEAHEEFRNNQKKRHITKDPAMADWNELLETLKRSNLQQVDHIEEKLKTIGCSIEKADFETIEPIIFEPEEIERLAEIEHGRWNVERIMDGWKLGDRDVEKKFSPYLVSWEELPEDVRKWDRQAVAKIQELLKKRGYKIVRENERTQ
jgi:ppGpp synthetase/RelA/SpoT-type nucleotidyltranferase